MAIEDRRQPGSLPVGGFTAAPRLLAAIGEQLTRPTSSLPLALFRIAFGLLMFVSTLRFMLRGWVYELYLAPDFHFPYLFFSWVVPLPAAGMYALFAALLLTSLLIAAGLFYRVAIVAFFVMFSYVELIDKTYYLNHYYFISLLSFLLIFLPLDGRLSLGCALGLRPLRHSLPSLALYAIRAQLAIVYLFAGIAKLQPDWLFAAQPLRIWLRANTELPLIGALFEYTSVAFAMSWFGMLFDLAIPFLLLWRRSRPFAYLAVVAFHLLTALLFPIGMFPWIMIVATLVFFSEDDLRRVSRLFGRRGPADPPVRAAPAPAPTLLLVVALSFSFQIGMALRHHAYPGSVLWTEEGYRFSWRVMLAEKTGLAIFTVRDNDTGERFILSPARFLTAQQAKQLSFQPDMILQFAHLLRDRFEATGRDDVSVYADVRVSVNGRSSRVLVDPHTDLAAQSYDLRPREWLIGDLE